MTTMLLIGQVWEHWITRTRYRVSGWTPEGEVLVTSACLADATCGYAINRAVKQSMLLEQCILIGETPPQESEI